jgi:DNA-binding response OmpR family regulator
MSLPSATQRILIVDDDKDVAPLFRIVLENAGYSVSSTLSGKEGLRAIREEAFELVILDLSMPDVDGFEILKAIRYQASKPKILVVSGHADLLAMATKFGADLTLDKLVAADVLAMAVRKLI